VHAMISHRVSRTIASLGLAASLALGLLAIPAASLAKVPHWTGSVVALPDTVTPGKPAGYAVKIHNNGPSNISKLYLFTLAGTESVVFTAPSQGTCNASGRLSCALGALRAGKDATVVVAFATSPAQTGNLDVTFEWDSTGLGSGSSDNSHGDALKLSASTKFSADGTNFAGGFVVSAGDKTVQNSQTIASGNRQSTKVVVNDTFIPASVQDGPGFTPPDLQTCVDTATFHCSKLFGEWSVVNVNNDANFPAYFKIFVRIDWTVPGDHDHDADDTPRLAYHQYFDLASDGWKQEIVSASCSTAAIPCLTVTKFTGYYEIEIHTFHNGNFRLG
jgi:hypothetical protein